MSCLRVYSCWVYFHFHPEGPGGGEGEGLVGATGEGEEDCRRSCPPTLSIGNSSELGLAVEAGWAGVRQAKGTVYAFGKIGFLLGVTPIPS